MEILAITLMITSLLVFGFRSYKLSILSYVFQTIILVATFLSIAYTYDAKELYSWAIVALVTKVILVPSILFYTIKKIGLEFENEPLGGFFVSPAIALIFGITTAFLITPIFIEFSLVPNFFALFASVFVFIVGIFGFILRNSFIKQILAYCLFENGIHLALALTAYNSHILIELGILTDAIFAVIIMCILAFRYFKAFGSLDVSIANNLKG